MDFSAFRWDRISAVVLGLLSVFVYLWMNPFDILPAPVAAGLSSIPVMAIFYGMTERSWKAAIVSGICVGTGIGVGTYIG